MTIINDPTPSGQRVDITDLIGTTSPPDNQQENAKFSDKFHSVEAYKKLMTELIGTNAIDPAVVAEIAERELLTKKSHYGGTRISLRRRGFASNQVYSNMIRPCTEAGNAERMCDLFAGELMYCHGLAMWYEWVGSHWKPCTQGEMTRHCLTMIKTILVEASLATCAKREKELLRHYNTSQAKRCIDATIDIAKDLKAFTVPLADLNCDPSILVCLNGTIELKTGSLIKHRPDDLVTRIVKVDFDPTADCPLWLEFLDTVFAGNKDVIEYVQTLIGYAATGEVREHKLAMLYGTGANGKSTFLVVLQHVLGDYAKQAAPNLLVARRGGDGPPFDVADLRGARFIVDSEVGQHATFDAAKVKRLTGGDILKARHLYRDYFEFPPEFKLFIAMNDKPNLPGDDEGIWRRVDLLPFEVQIPEDKRDLQLAEKLKAEAPGILRWIVEGAVKWYKNGLQPPKEVKYATDTYRAENDPVGEFLSQACVATKGASVGATHLYEAFKEWCDEQGIEPMKQTRFGKSMTKRKFERDKDKKGLSIYLGINFKDDDPPQPVDAPEGEPSSPDDQACKSTAPQTLPSSVPYDCMISNWLLDNAIYDPKGATRIGDVYRAFRKAHPSHNGVYESESKMQAALVAAGWPISTPYYIYDQLDYVVLKDKGGRVAEDEALPLCYICSRSEPSVQDDYFDPSMLEI